MSIVPERRERLQRLSPRSRATARRIEIQSEGYNVVGAMAMQRNALTSIQALDQAEDEMRHRLQNTLLDQRRALAQGDVSLALGLNQVAVALLGVVDQLDDAQDLDPVTQSFGHNFEAAQAGRRIIAMTEDPNLLPQA
ncbi:MAG: hypothetical protein ACM3US_09975 [Sphingomonadaceae bacterium]